MNQFKKAFKLRFRRLAAILALESWILPLLNTKLTALRCFPFHSWPCQWEVYIRAGNYLVLFGCFSEDFFTKK